jgi:hypothetical protein
MRLRDPDATCLANCESKFAKPSNSIALPERTRKNIVACSSTSPLKRVQGSMTKVVPVVCSLSAISCH